MSSLNDYNKKSSDVILKDIVKIFPSHDGKGDFTAVDHVSLTIKDGEMVTLLGPSGCGKTTTLRMIAGFEFPTSGEVLIGGRDIALVPPNKRDVSMVFQNYALFPHLCIWENIAYGLKVKKVPKAEIKERVKKIIDLMNLTGLEMRFPGQLSGGQQQRVALARAVVIEPSVLLFDEPLSNLDAKLREYMRDELRNIQKKLGITSLYVTHDQAEAMAISDRIIIMKDGKVQQMGTPIEIYEHPVNSFVANFIGKANFFDGVAVKRTGDRQTVRIGETQITVPIEKSISVEDGQKCIVAFRPESAKLSKENREGAIKVKVTNVTYFGSNVLYHCEAHGKTLIVEVSNPQLAEHFDAGEEVNLYIDVDCARALAE